MTQPIEPTPEQNPDAAPTVSPEVARALFTPPFQPQVIQLGLVVHVDPDGMWVEVPGMPGLFATGVTPTELGTSLGAAVEAYLAESVAAQLSGGSETPEAPDQP